MDWQRLINQFLPINPEDVAPFAPPREMAQAIVTYNRALTNLKSQNGDIALIALRKLTSSYPEFALAVLLYGLSLAAGNQLDKARECISQSLESGLPPAGQTIAAKALAQTDFLLEQQAALAASNSKTQADRSHQFPMPGAPAVLEKTGRRGHVRMASDKEREDVIRRGEYAQNDETVVKEARDPIEYLRIALPALAIVIAAGLLVFFGIRMISGISEKSKQNRENADRLTWLISRLEAMAVADPAIADLLEDYQIAFITTATTESTETILPTTAETTSNATAAPTESTQPAVPSTTSETSVIVATTLDPAVQSLIDAESAYRQATTLVATDLRGAGDFLLSARNLLAGIPGTTTAPGLNGDAATISQSVEDLILEIRRDAAEENRQLGMQLFADADYHGALPYFLTGYALYPRAYGGGVAYYCGRCYQLLGENTAAKPYFEYVISQYPDREIADYARDQLKAMGY